MEPASRRKRLSVTSSREMQDQQPEHTVPTKSGTGVRYDRVGAGGWSQLIRRSRRSTTNSTHVQEDSVLGQNSARPDQGLGASPFASAVQESVAGDALGSADKG